MELILAGLCFLALWIWGKYCDREKPWQKMYREAGRDFMDNKITADEYLDRTSKAFRLQHGIREDKKE